MTCLVVVDRLHLTNSARPLGTWTDSEQTSSVLALGGMGPEARGVDQWYRSRVKPTRREAAGRPRFSS